MFTKIWYFFSCLTSFEIWNKLAFFGGNSSFYSSSFSHIKDFFFDSIDEYLMLFKREIVNFVYDFFVTLFTYLDAVAWRLAADRVGLVYLSSNDWELGFYVSNNSTHYIAGMNSNLDTCFASIM